MRRKRPIRERYAGWRGIYLRAMRRVMRGCVPFDKERIVGPPRSIATPLLNLSYSRMGRLYGKMRRRGKHAERGA